MNENKRWCRKCREWIEHNFVKGDFNYMECTQCKMWTPVNAFARYEKRQLDYINKLIRENKWDTHQDQ